MKLFKMFFGRQSKSEDLNIYEELDENWADSITTGWQYTCNLFLTTPKICVENDGLISEGTKKPELFGEQNQVGPDGEPSGRYGSWTRRMGFEDQFDQFDNISENKIYARSSNIGKIPHKSKLEKDFKSFLIDFRTIVESYINIEEKISKINNELYFKAPPYSNIYKKLVEEEQFPDSFFKNELTILNGVNEKISSLLWEEGYLTPQYVLNAPEEELLKLKDLDLNLIRKIKDNQ
tara:strand:+ start:5147 stop:5851 length:705 start_codon:yes stop_codon:yes gene_type:complete